MRLIDADALYDKAEERYKSASMPYRQIYRGFVDDVADAPTVDTAQVVHGRWIYNEKGNLYRCSACLGYPSFIPTHCNISKFCPNCGAKMDLPEGGE